MGREALSRSAALREALMLYFFNLAGATSEPDEVGLDLPTMAEARRTAAVYGGEVLRDRPALACEGEALRIEVTDGERSVLFTLVIFGVRAAARGRT
jgi:hypothetical protein